MQQFENQRSSVPLTPQPLRTWDFMETTFVTLIAYGVSRLSGGLTLSVMLGMHDEAQTMSPAQLLALAHQGHWYGASLIVASLATVAVLWVAIRMAKRDFADYLALNWPPAGQFLGALGITAVLLWVEGIALSAAGSQDTATMPLFLSARQAGGLLILLIGGCIAAPIMEEFVVRGFMFRGWSQSFLGPVGAIVLSSALWGMSHTQYDWFSRFWIFVTGLLFGHFRWRSNSTWLTVMVHSALNTYLFFTMGLSYA